MQGEHWWRSFGYEQRFWKKFSKIRKSSAKREGSLCYFRVYFYSVIKLRYHSKERFLLVSLELIFLLVGLTRHCSENISRESYAANIYFTNSLRLKQFPLRNLLFVLFSLLTLEWLASKVKETSEEQRSNCGVNFSMYNSDDESG